MKRRVPPARQPQSRRAGSVLAGTATSGASVVLVTRREFFATASQWEGLRSRRRHCLNRRSVGESQIQSLGPSIGAAPEFDWIRYARYGHRGHDLAWHLHLGRVGVVVRGFSARPRGLQRKRQFPWTGVQSACRWDPIPARSRAARVRRAATRLNFIRQLLANPSKRKQLREINLPSYWKQTCRDPPPAARVLAPAREWAWTATGIRAGRPGGASPD